MQQYARYAEVAIEFFEWAFKSDEQLKHQSEQLELHQKAVQDEMDSIRRSLMVIEGTPDPPQPTHTNTEQGRDDFAT